MPHTRRIWKVGVSSVATLLLVLAAAPAASSADRAYWANGNNTISYANLDNSGGGGLLNLSGATANGARGVDIDPVEGRIYWANQGNHTISFANLDGSGGGGQLNLAGATIDKPHGVAIDPATRRIYWANDTGNPISWARLDGSGGGDLPTPGTTPAEPYGVAIDTAAGKIYWANRVTDTISYAKLDGSGGAELNIAGSTPEKPHGVAIDPVAGKVYWSNLGNTISFANTDGSGGGGELDLSGGGPGGPVGIALDPTAGDIWWANLGNDRISYAKLDGSGWGGQIDISGAASSDPRFLALVQTPRPSATPAITGGSAIGSVLSCSEPTWAPDMPDAFLYRAPLEIEYQWSRDGVDIAGAPTTVYTAFAPGTYRCRVTASNRAGETSRTSAPHVVSSPDVPGTGGTAPGGVVGVPGPAALPPAPASFAGSKRVITVNRAGGFGLTFRAPGALRGRVHLDSAGKVRTSRKSKRTKRLALARTSFAVPPSGNVTLRIRLSKANLRALRLNRRISTRITVTLTNAAGLTTTSRRTITLTAPSPLRR